MTPWRWWAGCPDEPSYDYAGDCATREEVIREAVRNIGPGVVFRIVEARSSEATKHEGSDCVPFLRTRNHEVLTAGQAETTSKPEGGEV